MPWFGFVQLKWSPSLFPLGNQGPTTAVNQVLGLKPKKTIKKVPADKQLSEKTCIRRFLLHPKCFIPKLSNPTSNPNKVPTSSLFWAPKCSQEGLAVDLPGAVRDSQGFGWEPGARLLRSLPAGKLRILDVTWPRKKTVEGFGLRAVGCGVWMVLLVGFGG